MSNAGAINRVLQSNFEAFPETRTKWLIGAGISVLRGAIGTQLFVSGSALSRPHGTLSFSVGRVTPALKAMLHGSPVLSLGWATRERNAVVSLLEKIGFSASSDCDIAISLNGAIVVFGYLETQPAVAHFTTTQTERRRVARQISGLTRARRELAGSDMLSKLPEPLRIANDFTIQSRVNGKFLDPHELTVDESTKAIFSGLEVAGKLQQLGKGRQTAARLNPLRLDEIVRVVGTQGRVLLEARDRFERWFSQVALPSVPTHGDLWIGNLSFNEPISEVKGVIDWESFDKCGLPFFDALHLIIMSVSSHRGVPFSEVLIKIWEYDDGYLRMLLDRACWRLGVGRSVLQWVAIATWINLVAQGTMEPRPNRFASWVDDTVGRTGSIVMNWLALNRHDN